MYKKIYNIACQYHVLYFTFNLSLFIRKGVVTMAAFPSSLHILPFVSMTPFYLACFFLLTAQLLVTWSGAGRVQCLERDELRARQSPRFRQMGC
jgi:hypothetical protein